MTDVDRRAFLQTSVVSAAALVAAPRLVNGLGSSTSPSKVAPSPASKPTVTPAMPSVKEPVMAYVRDACTGEVTVLVGTRQTTYHDPALVRRLLDAAR